MLADVEFLDSMTNAAFTAEAAHTLPDPAAVVLSGAERMTVERDRRLVEHAGTLAALDPHERQLVQDVFFSDHYLDRPGPPVPLEAVDRPRRWRMVKSHVGVVSYHQHRNCACPVRVSGCSGVQYPSRCAQCSRVLSS